jgi:hypothetical protein
MADFTYERGDPSRPVGHALLYFTTSSPDEVQATYIVVPPIMIDFAKYVPPLLASSLGSAGLLAQTSFLPVPPAPEQMNLSELRRIAAVRGDDLIVAGSASAWDVASLMALVAELGDAYASAYRDAAARDPALEPEREPSSSSDAAASSALLYSVLSEVERLGELSRQVGLLRYALEGNDHSAIESTRAEMRAVAAYLPEKYRANELIEAASRPDRAGARLAELYIERGYKLQRDDFEAIAPLDREIASLQAMGREA